MPNKGIATKETLLPVGYVRFLSGLKDRIRKAQVKAALSVNSELIKLYWQIGHEILLRQENEGWGSKVVARLGADLLAEFPEMGGLSPRNLLYMRAFAEAYRDPSIVQQVAAQLPWAHNMVLLDKLKRTEDRLWYATAAVQHGWSRAILAAQISAKAHKRHGKAVTNFKHTLPPDRSDLAHQTLKDPYTFDFLRLGLAAREHELEQGLVDHIQKFLIELGVGFAFVGRQVHIEVDGTDYRIDLLFYHLRLRSYVVIDLKMEPLKPEFVGKMNFYLNAVDDQMRHPDDQPTIGLLLCQGNKRLTIEYALRGVTKPIGVAEWRTRLVDTLPKKFQRALPSVEAIGKELRKLPARKAGTKRKR